MQEYFKFINGLRGISILLVVLYHTTQHKYLENAFLGVDIFFVISGFILTYKYLEKINIKTFFINRFKRIIPTLTLTIIISLLILNLYVSDSFTYNQNISLIRNTLFFINNLYLLENINYFHPEVSNLLTYHLWSLSIEEQFYIIFPFIILIGKNNHKYIIFIFLILFAIFLFSSITLVNKDLGLDQPLMISAQNFFHPLIRFLEILFGCIAAILVKKTKIKIHFVFIYLTLLLISYLYFFTSFSNQYHPGFITIIFSSLISFFILCLYLNKNNYINKVLEIKFFQIYGNISYTLYLLHIPLIFTWSKYFENTILIEKIMSFLIISIASFMVWKWYEYPLYKGKIKYSQILSFITIYIILILVCFKLNKDIDVTSNYKFQQIFDENKTFNKCLISSDIKKIEPDCFKVDESKKNIVFWGDSLASALAITFKKKYKEFNVITFTGSSCTPRHYSEEYDDFDGKHCKVVNNIATNFISKNKNLKIIVHSLGRFKRFDPEVLPNIKYDVIGISPRWRGHMLGIITPDYSKNKFYTSTGLENEIFKADTDYKSYFKKFDNVNYVSLLDILCQENNERDDLECLVFIKNNNKVITYSFDHMHMSYDMAGFLYENFLIDRIFKN
jgi:peptidoglycan/LPS O-acetylase OafA/YrhL